MKKILYSRLAVAALFMSVFAANTADMRADLQKKIATLKRHREEQVQLMHEANLIDPSLGESYKGVIDADDRKIAEFERNLSAR